MTDRPPVRRVLVVIPTYNESESLPDVLARLLAVGDESAYRIDVLVVDDASPDGTGAVADAWAAGDRRVEVLHRPAKKGLGAAYLAGFNRALGRGETHEQDDLERRYDAIVEMDADGSHAPEQLPDLLAALEQADLALGSRWVAGGSVVDWPRWREALSRGGNGYARRVLRIPLSDSTGGFRAYRREALLGIDLAAIASEGYCFQVDLARRVLDAGFTVREVPIQFVERASGRSKMSRAIVAEALVRVTLWGITARISGRRPPAGSEAGSGGLAPGGSRGV